MAVASVRDMHAAVLAVLRAIDPTNLTVYDGEVIPEPKKDNDERVHPYAVLYSDGGRPHATGLCGTSDAHEWSFVVVCVGGDQNRCLWAVDKVRAALIDLELTVAGRSMHRVREEVEAPRVRRDDTVRPALSYVPLMFRADSDAA